MQTHIFAPVCALWAAALLLSAGAAYAQTRELSTSGVLLDRIAAIVNNGVVLKSEVDEQVDLIMQRYQDQGMRLPPRGVLRQQVLEQLITQELQLQRAEQAGIRISDEMLNSRLKEIAAGNGIALDELPTVLQQQGIDYASFRESLRKELTIGAVQQRDVYRLIVVTPRELDQYLQRQSSLENEDFDVSHILVSVPEAATPEEAAAAEKRAREIYQRAIAGEDFAQLAITYSSAQTALDGGSLGWRKGAELPSFIANLIVNMSPGDIAEPVRTPSGFHIVKLNDRRGTEEQVLAHQVHVRHILIRPTELQDADTVRQRLLTLRQRILDGEDFAVVAQSTSEDPGSAAQGGDLGWMEETAFVPEFSRMVATLEENEISEPFRTSFGWHIVQLLGRRIEDVTEEKRRQEAFAALRASKVDEELELYLRSLRDRAYIEYKS